MNQTVKFGKLRAKQDPDRSKSNPGTYYGSNFSYRLNEYKLDQRTTRGSMAK